MKKLGKAVLLMSMLLTLAACGKQEVTQVSDAIETKPSVVEENPTQEGNYVFSWQGENEFFGEEPGAYQELRYELAVLDDNRAIMTRTYFYPEDALCESIEKYQGTYEKKDAQILFHANRDIYAFIMNGDTVVNVEYHYMPDIEEDMTGTYTCSSKEFGELTLTVNEYYDVKLTTSENRIFNGNLVNYTGRLEVLLTEEGGDDTLYDWYIDFDDNTFTYEDYYYATNAEFAGEYHIWGQLGDLTVVVDESGMATCTFPLESGARTMTGRANFNFDTKELNYIYFYDEEGYSIDLYINPMDELLNYYGTVSTPLSAG